MDETVDNSIRKASINLSRNRPVALVVGAAGFLGSHLVDKLLEKDIQVVGIDNLETGRKENLREATGNKNFHLVIDSPQELDLDLDRLDYLFVVTEDEWNLERALEIFKRTKCRLLLVSSIDLYGKESEFERKIAKFATSNNLNARVLRLGPIYGPRMDFNTDDPLIKLIQQAINGDLQKDLTLEFSSRALYVADAVDLAIRTIFAGSTAQKIFDGVLPSPIKVSEIKQVLLDPVWYESRGFTPADLPPWPTPNLEKTIKILNWHPKHKLVAGLRKTLSYFKDNEIEVPELEARSEKLDEEKKEELELFKHPPEVKEAKKKIKIGWGKIYLLAVIALVTYALIWPSVLFGWGLYTFQSNFKEGLGDLEKAELGLTEVRTIYGSLEPLKKISILSAYFEDGDKFINKSLLSVSAAKHTILGLRQISEGLKAVSGEKMESPAEYFERAQIEVSAAKRDLDQAGLLIKNQSLNPMAELIKHGQVASFLIPNLTAIDGSKNYLVLLQNNMELQPVGGRVTSFAKISFEGGKLEKFEVKDINTLGQLDIYEEPDFPFNARRAEWVYTKATGEKVDGVIALDATAIAQLLTEPVTAETGNLTQSANSLFNKIFFLPQDNWQGILKTLGQALAEKHLSVYFNDPKLYSYLQSQGQTQAMPRQSEQNSKWDFLSLIEANLGGNSVNFYLDRSYKLETAISKDGEVKHRLRVNYTNRSPGVDNYKNRLRVYLPFGAKLTRVLWGEGDITKDVTSFVDYGRSGYSMLLELAPKEQKTLVLDYAVPVKLQFADGKASYRLDIIKQAGTLKDPLEWTITYPISYQLVSNQTKAISPQEQTIQTDLSVDRSFEVEFKK